MKTLKLSAFALLLMSVFSCTKSSNTLDQTQQVTKTVVKPNTPQDNIVPGMVVNFNPSPGVVGEEVTVTGEFDGSTLIPDCGKLQLFQKVDGNWVKKGDASVSSSSHSVTYQFIPTVPGDNAYEFRLQYIAQGCDGFREGFSSSFFLDVIETCHGLTLTGNVISAEPDGSGNYTFTVDYTVNTCGVEYTYLKTQGGLTAWSSDVVSTTPPATLTQVGNSSHPNTIVKWEENSPFAGNSKTYRVVFKKAWSGTGTVQLTGDWSVTAVNNGTEVARVEFLAINYHL